MLGHTAVDFETSLSRTSLYEAPPALSMASTVKSIPTTPTNLRAMSVFVVEMRVSGENEEWSDELSIRFAPHGERLLTSVF